jgi:hypothetical protein
MDGLLPVYFVYRMDEFWRFLAEEILLMMGMVMILGNTLVFWRNYQSMYAVLHTAIFLPYLA